MVSLRATPPSPPPPPILDRYLRMGSIYVNPPPFGGIPPTSERSELKWTVPGAMGTIAYSLSHGFIRQYQWYKISSGVVGNG